jgi:hypothetical protein
MTDTTSNITTNPIQNINILKEPNMTALVTTVDGINYTVIARPNVGVVLIIDSDKSGLVLRGKYLVIINGKLFLKDKNQRRQYVSDTIVRVHILTN